MTVSVAWRAMVFFGSFYFVAACGLAFAGAHIDYRERRSYPRLLANLASSAVLLMLFAGWLWPAIRIGATPLVAILFVLAAVWECKGTIDELRSASRGTTADGDGPPRYAVVAVAIFFVPVVVLAGMAAFGV